MLEHKYDPWQAYAQSKLALTMFIFDLAERLNADTITANRLHPGSMLDTKMVRQSSGSPWGSAESGAEVEIFVATDPSLVGTRGRYFKEKQEGRAHEQAYDAKARDKLRRLSKSLTGVE